MNKKEMGIIIGMIMVLGVLALWFSGPAEAAQAPPKVRTITATVDDILTLGITIVPEIAPGNLGSPVTSMDHGTLVRDSSPTGEAFALRGKAFHVFLGSNTSGKRYEITSDMSPMKSGANQLPDALGVFPAQAHRGDPAQTDITGDDLLPGGPQSALGFSKVLYRSNPEGQASVVELVYALSGGNADGSKPFTTWTPVAPDQAAGTYVSTISFTLTTL